MCPQNVNLVSVMLEWFNFKIPRLPCPFSSFLPTLFLSYLTTLFIHLSLLIPFHFSNTDSKPPQYFAVFTGACYWVTVEYPIRMEESHPVARRWEELDIDTLVKIFQHFDIIELTSGIAHVCSTWRMAAHDPLLWKTLDLSMLKSNFIKIPFEPYVYVHGQSDKFNLRILKISLSLSRGYIITLVFHFNLYLSDDQLTYTAERCPRLRRLVLPAWNRIKKSGICKAIRAWPDLESLTMPSIANPPYLLEEIAKNCKNFTELKIMGPCDMNFASTLVEYLPKLKVLSVRCSVLFKEALVLILDGLQNLEVLNISHCIVMEIPPPPAPKRVVTELDEVVLQKASRLNQFISCMSTDCQMCQRTRNDEGLMRWYKYEEGLWKADEILTRSDLWLIGKNFS